MPNHLRRALFVQFSFNVIVCLGVSLGLAFVTGGLQAGLTSFAWPVTLALGLGVFVVVSSLLKIKRGVLKSIPHGFALASVRRADWPQADWALLDDYAAQLSARGYTCAGDFTLDAPAAGLLSVVSIHFDADGSTAVELQHLIQIPAHAAAAGGATGVHFSIASLLAGRVAVSVSDHPVHAANYLLGYPETVVASYPGLNLTALLDKHATLLAYLHDQTGQGSAPGLNIHRYVLLQRERFDAARARILRLNGWQIISALDAFAAWPKNKWAPPPPALRALVMRPLAEIELRSDAGVPTVIDAAGLGLGAQAAHLSVNSSTQTSAHAMAPATQDPVAAPAAADSESHNPYRAPASAIRPVQRRKETPESAALKAKIQSDANWFYWIAGLSAANAISSLLGSSWGFPMGLGSSLVLGTLGQTGGAEVAAAASEASPGETVQWVVWLLCAALIGLFATIGQQARKPSAGAFLCGLVLYAADAAIFLLLGDWIGLALHALALYFIWRGWMAAREYQKL